MRKKQALVTITPYEVIIYKTLAVMCNLIYDFGTCVQGRLIRQTYLMLSCRQIKNTFLKYGIFYSRTCTYIIRLKS